MNISSITARSLFISTLLFCLSFSPSSYGKESIGQVVLAYGKITATDANVSRSLRRGSKIFEGDVVITSDNAHAQLRMYDGALIALRPDTDFSFDEYKYNTTEPSTSSSIFSLLKGGFRTISGWIGKNNRENYRVNTSVATIGIRGTHYGLRLCEHRNCNVDDNTVDDGLYGSVIDGEIVSNNNAGEFTFTNDEYFHITSINAEPKHLIAPPGVIFDKMNVARKKTRKKAQEKFKASLAPQRRRAYQAAFIKAVIEQQQDLALQQAIEPVFKQIEDAVGTTPVKRSPKGTALSFATFTQDVTGAIGPISAQVIDDTTGDNAVFLKALTDSELHIPVGAHQVTANGTYDLFINEAKPVEVQAAPLANNIVTWGRWRGNFGTSMDGKPIPHVPDLHFVTSTALTSPTELASLTAFVSYTTAAGTLPTDFAGNLARSPASINMDVDFGKGNINSYSVGTMINNVDYSAFSTVTPITSALQNGIPLTGSCGPINCGGQASLGFVGAKAEGAITSFAIQSTDPKVPNVGASGAAVLTSGGLPLK